MGQAGDNAKRYYVPDTDEHEWIEMFDLGFLDFDAATAENERRQRQAAREWGPVYTDLLDRGERQREKARGKRPATDPFETHDTLTLLDRGIYAWSYERHLPERTAGNTPEERRQQAERFAAIGKLHKETATWAARTLLDNGHIANAWGLPDADAIDIDVIEASAGYHEDDEENPTSVTSLSRWTGS